VCDLCGKEAMAKCAYCERNLCKCDRCVIGVYVRRWSKDAKKLYKDEYTKTLCVRCLNTAKAHLSWHGWV
jgi:hypothetical protein